VKSISLIAGAGALLLVAGCAARHQPAPVPPPVAAVAVTDTPHGVVKEGLVTASARVEAIDLQHRVVTLRGPEGNLVDLEVGDEVRNLPQVRKGDEVLVTYYEAIAITVRKPGETTPGVTHEQHTSRAELGQKPAGTKTRETTVTATVVGVNKRQSTVTVKGPRGKVVTVAVKDPDKLEGVKVRDLVEVVYTQALAISVEKPTSHGSHR
jgi:hypothetical protein